MNETWLPPMPRDGSNRSPGATLRQWVATQPVPVSGRVVQPFVIAADESPRGVAEPLLAVGAFADGELRGVGVAAQADATGTVLPDHAIARVRPDRPLALAPVIVPKPWGREVWFTGIESRGVSDVIPESGPERPLHHWLWAWPDVLLGCAGYRPPVLLKILDPHPHDPLGDLYLEFHDRKQEVYVVCGVDPAAWPDGVGGIRFGIAPTAHESHPDEPALREAFVAAAEAYEAHRREVDAWLDGQKQAVGLDPAEPASPEQVLAWLRTLPEAWRKRESRLKADLDAFLRVLPLRVGDVVTVPCRLPHSLLHGVRVVEFQTPVYERQILAFAQKVLTQDGWDTRAAADRMRLDAPLPAALPVLSETEGVRVEEVVAFDDFGVWRVRLSPGADFQHKPAAYGVVMGLVGHVIIDGETMAPEEARLLPAAVASMRAVAGPEEAAVFLLAEPRVVS